jgi:AraC-like DNA-binding protein
MAQHYWLGRPPIAEMRKVGGRPAPAFGSRTTIKRIAQRYGFGSAQIMSRSFLRLLAVTPQDYRSRFTF